MFKLCPRLVRDVVAPARPLEGPAVAAWFLPGADTDAWLRLLAAFPQAVAFVVPQSSSSTEPGGLLVIFDVASPSHASSFVRRGLPLRALAGGVLVPFGWVVSPALTEMEAKAWHGADYVFFPPTRGAPPIALHREDRVYGRQLLAAPLVEPLSGAEGMAGPLPPDLPILARVELLISLAPEQLFPKDSAEIGSQAPQPEEPSRFLQWLRKAVQAPGQNGNVARPNTGTTKGGLRDWLQRKFGNLKQDAARRVLHRLEADLAKRQQEQLERLVELLKKDPTEGLRRAITLGGSLGRGTAAPSSQLGYRSSLNIGAAGAGKNNTWDVEAAMRNQLSAQYRAMAGQMHAEGNYERAAFIYAELLGDWHAAAEALSRGGRYHEAAQIYLQRLQNKPAAAECYERGGLTLEALQLYALIPKHEKCGDLWITLGQPAQAFAAYHAAIAAAPSELEKARIHWEKLEDAPAAIELLNAAWPNGPQAKLCLERQVDYLNQLEDVPAQLALLERLSLPENQLPKALDTLSVFQRMVDGSATKEVRERASILGLRFVTKQAEVSQRSHFMTNLLPKLAALVPDDSLLRRDVLRFQERQLPQAPMLAKEAEDGIEEGGGRGQLFPRFHLQLKTDAVWLGLTSGRQGWLATGLYSAEQNSWARLVVHGLSGLAEGAKGKLHTHCFPGRPDFRLASFIDKDRAVIPCNEADDDSLDAVSQGGGLGYYSVSQNALIQYPVETFRKSVLCSKWFCKSLLIASDPHRQRMATLRWRGRSQKPMLCIHSINGDLQNGFEIALDDAEDGVSLEHGSAVLRMKGQWVALLLGNQVVVIHASGREQRFRFPGGVQGLDFYSISNAASASLHLLIAHGQEVSQVYLPSGGWGQKQDAKLEPICTTGHGNARICLYRKDAFAVADNAGVRLWTLRGRKHQEFMVLSRSKLKRPNNVDDTGVRVVSVAQDASFGLLVLHSDGYLEFLR